MNDDELQPAKFLSVYEDEDKWYRFKIIMNDGSVYKSGEYLYKINAENDLNYCQRKNSVSDIAIIKIE